MDCPITSQNVGLFARTNEHLITSPIRGIVLRFHGLNMTAMLQEDQADEVLYARHGLLSICPYAGPWSWMNDVAVRTVDAILAALLAKYQLSKATPIVSSGGSMGGLSAFVYAVHGAYGPVAVAADCPACDLLYHYSERPDVARTVWHAFAHYDTTLEEAMQSASPLHLVGQLPDVPYYMVAGDADEAVSIAHHADRMAAAMTAQGLALTYVRVPGMGHCQMPAEVADGYRSFILAAIQ